MSRPKILHVGGVLYWVIRTRNPDAQVLKDADSTPTIAVRKNGSSVGDSVTVTKRSATTGIYDCSYDPAGEVEGDEFTIEESATVTGTTTAQATYANSWEFTVIAVERGTDGANTTTPPTAAANATAVRSELATELARVDATISSRASSAEALDIQSRIPATLDSGNMRSSVQSMAPNTLTASALASDAVAEIAAAVGGSGGTGARTVTITVNDGTTPIQGALVRVSQGAESYVLPTNSSGVVTFYLDDFVWSVVITKPGFEGFGTDLTVNGNEAETYSMTALSLTASDPDKVTGYWTVFNELGVATAGKVVTVRALQKQSGSTGILHLKTPRTATSDSSGVAQFANMLAGWTYSVSLDGETVAQVTIPFNATGTVELGSCVLAESE